MTIAFHQMDSYLQCTAEFNLVRHRQAGRVFLDLVRWLQCTSFRAFQSARNVQVWIE